MGSVACGEYEIPAPLVLQSLSITSVAREMAGALTVSATFVLNLGIAAIARPGGSWLTVWAQPTQVSPEHRFPSWTASNTRVSEI